MRRRANLRAARQCVGSGKNPVAMSWEGEPMNFSQAIRSCLVNYARFSGRAVRSEYWNWILLLILGRIATKILGTVIFGYPFNEDLQPLSVVFSLVVLVPTFAVAVRRLHDVDRSGWWLLTYLTVIGMIYPLLVWKCTEGTVGENRFGPDPRDAGSRVANVFS
jgi:uncharacterized membrane protein YhaH (DUF805 family)